MDDGLKKCTIYVLQCEHNKYYIGKTLRPLYNRVEEHFKQNGCAWTRLHQPIRVVDVERDADGMDEDKYTKIYMKRYGIDNVRGGTYSSLELPDYQLLALGDELSTAENACFRCHRTGHFKEQCYAKTYPDGSRIEDRSPEIVRVPSENSSITESTCFRCSRPGHFVEQCYATTYPDGSPITSDFPDSFTPPFASTKRNHPNSSDISSAPSRSQKKPKIQENEIRQQSEKKARKSQPSSTTAPQIGVNQNQVIQNIIFNFGSDQNFSIPTMISSLPLSTPDSEPCKKKSNSNQRNEKGVKCSRCNRVGHKSSNCYARSTQNGSPL